MKDKLYRIDSTTFNIPNVLPGEFLIINGEDGWYVKFECIREEGPAEFVHLRKENISLRRKVNRLRAAYRNLQKAHTELCKDTNKLATIHNAWQSWSATHQDVKKILDILRMSP